MPIARLKTLIPSTTHLIKGVPIPSRSRQNQKALLESSPSISIRPDHSPEAIWTGSRCLFSKIFLARVQTHNSIAIRYLDIAIPIAQLPQRRGDASRRQFLAVPSTPRLGLSVRFATPGASSAEMGRAALSQTRLITPPDDTSLRMAFPACPACKYKIIDQGEVVALVIETRHPS
jgi:hypothetical protein